MRINNCTEIRQKLLSRYSANKRELPWRRTKYPYPVWVSEVMLQQTQVKTVLKYYDPFMEKFPNIGELAQADVQDVLKAWEGMGYYARARNLHDAAAIIVKQYNGIIPNTKEELLKLPGVGDYIAAAVLSIAFGRPLAVVDGNVKRLLARLFVIDEYINASGSLKTFKSVAEQLLDISEPGAFNQALMEFGATICKSGNPACHACPLKGDCLAYRYQKVSEYPKKASKKERPEYHIAVGVVFKKGKVLITRRKHNGLLGGLWEFPGGKVRDGEKGEIACIREIREEVNLVVKVDSCLTRIRHEYSHFKIVMDVFICRYISGRVRLTGPAAHQWIKIKETDQYPFPGANHKFLPLLKEKQSALKAIL